MNATLLDAIKHNLASARSALEFAEQAIAKGLTATCSYELEAVAELVKGAQAATSQAMRERVAALEEKEAKEVQKI